MMSVVKKEEFGPIKVKREFLGIEEGTVLKFDPASSKYVSMGAEEEIGEGEYYYSGFAVALDPYLVRDNSEFFVLLDTKKPKKKLVKEEPVVEQKPQVEAPKVEEPVQEPVPLDIPEGDLSFVCGLCHTENFIHRIKYGLFFPVAPGTRLQLKCSNCGIESAVYYNMGDELNKESK